MVIIRGPLTVWTEGVFVVREVRLEGEERDISCRGCVLTHSFVNAHTHLPMSLLRGLVTEKNFWDWLSEVQRLEELMGKKEVEAGYLIGLWENLISGNTVVYSMYRGYELIRETLGIEVHAGPISFREADRDVFSLLERFERSAPQGVVPTLFAHSLYTLPRERLREIAEIISERNIEFQIHASETKEEVLKVKEMFGQYPVRVLDAMGLLGRKTMLVHAGWVTKGELDIVAARGSSLVHVPASNARLAIHGFFPWKEAEERGIKVFFGTDSPASNDGQSVLHDLRLALLSAKDRYWDASLFGRKSLTGAFDRKGFALWRPVIPVPRGEPAVTTLLYAPHLFRLVLVTREGRVLYPVKRPPSLKRAFRIAEKFVSSVLF